MSAAKEMIQDIPPPITETPILGSLPIDFDFNVPNSPTKYRLQWSAYRILRKIQIGPSRQ